MNRRAFLLLPSSASGAPTRFTRYCPVCKRRLDVTAPRTQVAQQVGNVQGGDCARGVRNHQPTTVCTAPVWVDTPRDRRVVECPQCHVLVAIPV